MKLMLLTYILLNSMSSSCDIEIALSVDKSNIAYDMGTHKIRMLEGVLTIYNNTNEKIVLPQSFDLGIFLLNKHGNEVKENENVIDEYENLIIKNKSFTIMPKEKISINFSENRLSFFKLIEGEVYSISYEFNVSILGNKKTACSEKSIRTNTERFLYH